MFTAEKGQQVLDEYRTSVRPYLERCQVAGVDALDRAAAILESEIKRYGAPISVGFAGETQVGKSSLINALLERTVLPAGGVGPLTARATHVKFGPDPTIQVTYHDRKQIQQFAFVLEARLSRLGQTFSETDRTDFPEGFDADEVAPDPESIRGDDPGASEAREQATKKVQYIIAQAKMLFASGESGSSAPPIMSECLALEALRSLIGFRIRCDAEELAPYAPRIAELRAKLGTSETLQQSVLGSHGAFKTQLHLRAAGWLSPIVAKLNVALNSGLPKGLEITDLPGIGVVGDPAALEAQKFVANGGDALVLVMRNSGITEELARLLEKSGVIRRLLFGGRGERMPIQVLVAVTHLDDVARERYAQRVEEALDSESPPPSAEKIYGSLAEPMVATIRHQLGAALQNSRAFDDLPSEDRVRREEVIAQLMSTLDIQCVAAPDYAALTYRKNSAGTFLQDCDATGVPALRQRIFSLAEDTSRLRADAIGAAMQSLQELAAEYLTALEQLYSETGGQAQAAWDTFRMELQAFAGDLKPELAAHQGELLATLRNVVPERIGKLCLKAESVAVKRLIRLRSVGEGLHYQSLNAALVRNGVWGPRQIDYPDNITSSLVDAIATAWEPEVIETVRSSLRAWADRSVAVVGKLVIEAHRRDPRIMTEAQVETWQKIFMQQSRTAVAWTRERLEELRKNIQSELYQAVLKPIERACVEAVKAGKNRNLGAKRRILEAFHEGGNTAIEKARERAERILNKHYDTLISELNRGFLQDNHDPIQAVLDLLTSDELIRARRSDAQKRRWIHDGILKAREQLAITPARQPEDVA